MEMEGFASSGLLARRLTAAQTSETRVSDKHETTESNETNEDVIMLDRHEAALNEAVQGSLEYADVLIGGVNNDEVRTTRTTKPMKGKRTKVPLDSFQWIALSVAGVFVLASAAWWATEMLPQFAKPKPVPMPIPQYDAYDVKWQFANLQMAVARLNRTWEQASESVKREFMKKYFNMYLEDGEMPENLQVLLEPAENLVSLGLPKEEEDKDQKAAFSKNVTLAAGALQAATHRLTALSKIEEYKEKKKQAREMAEELQRESTELKETGLVDFEGFAQMLSDGDPLATAKTGVPKRLAQRFLDEMIICGIRDEADLRVQADFTVFKALVDGKESVPVYLPGTDKAFPLPLFFGLLEPVGKHERIPFQLTLQLSTNWNTKTARQVLEAIKKREMDINFRERTRREAFQRKYKHQILSLKKDGQKLSKLKLEKETAKSPEHKKDKAQAIAKDKVLAAQREARDKVKDLKAKKQEEQEERRRQSISKLKTRDNILYADGKSVSRVLGKPVGTKEKKQEEEETRYKPDFFLSLAHLI